MEGLLGGLRMNLYLMGRMARMKILAKGLRAAERLPSYKLRRGGGSAG